jgi:pimeloyl-ACP methyl ester carboxylesterase
MTTLPSSRLILPYIEQGDPDGVPLVLIHGLTDSHRSYEPILAELPLSIRAFALTMRGHGDAPKPESGYAAADFASDVIAFMDAFGIERAVIGGHSMGSWIARRIAADHPDRVLGVVLAGCFATCDVLRPLLDEFESLEDPVPADYAREWQESTLARPIPEAFMQTIIEETRKPPLRVWTAALTAMVADPQEGLITAPTLLSYGERDALVPRAHQDALLEAIPRAELIVNPGGGHAFHWEQPERYAAQLMGFAAML